MAEYCRYGEAVEAVKSLSNKLTQARKVKPRHRSRWRKWLVRIVAVLAGVFLIYHGLLLFRIFQLRRTNPDTTAFIQQRENESAARGVKLNRQQVWVPYEQISPNLLRAVVIGEDPRFYSHSGLDWQAIRRAAHINWEEKKIVRGGSTIHQQLAKNLFFSSSRNPLRKLHEGLVAWEMERILGKRRILELYVNVIEWGDGIYGAEAAARHYFNQSTVSLTDEQAAFLAALIPGPREAFNPALNPDRVAQRRNRILAFMGTEEIAEAELRSLATKTVMPTFTAAPNAKIVEGVVVVQLDIDEQGNITQLNIIETPDPAITAPLSDALRQWQFKPPHLNGQPITIRGKLTFYYVIKDGAAHLQNAKSY